MLKIVDLFIKPEIYHNQWQKNLLASTTSHSRTYSYCRRRSSSISTFSIGSIIVTPGFFSRYCCIQYKNNNQVNYHTRHSYVSNERCSAANMFKHNKYEVSRATMVLYAVERSPTVSVLAGAAS